MILVGQYDSPFVRRVAVTLNTYRLPFERSPLSVFGNFAELQKLNPLGRVPALILDDQEVLIDSSAIIDHLDEKVGPARALMPRDGSVRRKILNFVSIAHGTAEKVVQATLDRFFHDEPDRSTKLEKRLFAQIEAGLATLEAACGEHWLVGGHLTHADVMAGCMLSHLNLRIPTLFQEQKYRKLHAFGLRCELNAAFVAARIGANETMPARS